MKLKVLNLIQKNYIKSAHDVSLGGIITAIAKMCINGNKGIKLKKPNYLIHQFEYLFGEDQGRYIVEIKPENLEKTQNMLKKDSIHFDKLGLVEGSKIIFENDLKISIDDIKEGYKKWLKEYMVN